jgi:DNA-binding transcriptional ArsR family regulator
MSAVLSVPSDARSREALSGRHPIRRKAGLGKHMLNHSPDLSRLFGALSDPARRAMVERLSRGDATVSELAQPLPMSLPATLQHLAVLESAGLVRSQKVGRVRTCSIDAAALSLAERWISAKRIEWEHRLDCLGAYLAKLPKED